MVSSSALLSGLLIKRLDHLELVASICKELKIAETIDTIIPKPQDCHVTHAQALMAIILNGLGFHSRTLHIFPDFFKQKPTQRFKAKGFICFFNRQTSQLKRRINLHKHMITLCFTVMTGDFANSALLFNIL